MKIGDKVNVFDRSYGFGVCNGQFVREGIPIGLTDNAVIVQTNLFVMQNVDGDRYGRYREQNDLIVRDIRGGLWFTQSRFCKLVGKKIDVRYFCGGKDITDSISDETKRNLQCNVS